jgi:anti-sigma regulatory factor (Ser/Thr protein kinase)
MKELSLHILDIVQNSIKAGATLIEIIVNEDVIGNKLSIKVKDNGKGMDKETVKKVIDPFFTTRTVRNVGLGIPLLKNAAERCNGKLTIESEVNKGTILLCEFDYDHIDRAPLGRMEDTILTLFNDSEKFDIEYSHMYNGKTFVIDSREIKKMLDGVSLDNPDVLLWLKEYIYENITLIRNS